MKIKTSLGRKVFLVCNFVFLALSGLVCILPFVNLLAISFSDKLSVAAGRVSFWPINFNLNSYSFILTRNGAFNTAFWVSIRRVLLGVSINLTLIVLLAYPLSRETKDFRGRNVISWFFVVTILFNGGLIPSYMIVRYTHLIDTMWALVLPGAIPVFNMLVVMNYFRGLPQELNEAAYIDGANHLQTLVRVILPISTPTLATVGLFCIVGHWNAWFDGFLYMNDVTRYPLQSYLRTVVINPEEFFRNSLNISQDMQQFVELVNARTMQAAQLFLATIPVLIAYPFLQKYFTTGLVMGSVKG